MGGDIQHFLDGLLPPCRYLRRGRRLAILYSAKAFYTAFTPGMPVPLAASTHSLQLLLLCRFNAFPSLLSTTATAPGAVICDKHSGRERQWRMLFATFF